MLSKEAHSEARGMIDRSIRQRTAAFNVSHREQWDKIKTREQWEKYRDERIERCANRLALGPNRENPRSK